MTINREAVESPLRQGVDEIVAYSITTTPWGSTPTSISVVVKDVTNSYQDVTSVVMPTNSPTANGDVITLSPLKLLTLGHTYRVEVLFTTGSNTWEPYFIVEAQK